MNGAMAFIKRNAVTLLLFLSLAGFVAYQRIPMYLHNRSAMEKPPAMLDGRSLEGQQYTLGSLQGKVVVISFWATWCMPCRAEIPMLNSIYEELHDQGLVILGITAEPASVVQDFLKDRPISYPVVIDQGAAITNRYKVQAFPTLVVIDREGKIVDRATGLDFFVKWKLRHRVTGSYF